AGSHGEFMDKVMAYAREFTPPNKASKAVGLIKRSIQSGADLPFESALTLERELQQQLFQSSDAKEGIAAYNEKRKAQFTGR
ncbi:MAG TPA: enoyl-CoA hydratase-related protein, partial [Longimicrobiales bacterium]|nr:enoyl-CoA hydratase-related protein [Longimicrobiales bacterium]